MLNVDWMMMELTNDDVDDETIFFDSVNGLLTVLWLNLCVVLHKKTKLKT